MSQPRRQHYVSEMQQRHFTDDKGKLYFFRKSQRETGALQSIPEKIFVEKDHYTLFWSCPVSVDS